MRVSAVLFDLDGTLVDSIDLIVACFTHACNTRLGRAPGREWIVTTIGRPLAEILEEVAPGRSAELLAAYSAHNEVYHDRLLRPYQDAIDLVRALHARDLPLGIVTSKRRAGALRALTLYDLTPMLQVLVALEDTVRHKPAPDPLLEGALQLGLSPARILYVGDSTHDIRAAHAAGMPVAAVLWGAGAERDLRALGPNIVVPQPHDLLEWLEATSGVSSSI